MLLLTQCQPRRLSLYNTLLHVLQFLCQRNWRNIMLAAANIVVDNGEDYNSHKDDRRPVEIRRICWRSLGPETPEHYEDGVDNGSNVDRETPFP